MSNKPSPDNAPDDALANTDWQGAWIVDDGGEITTETIFDDREPEATRTEDLIFYYPDDLRTIMTELSSEYDLDENIADHIELEDGYDDVVADYADALCDDVQDEVHGQCVVDYDDQCVVVTVATTTDFNPKENTYAELDRWLETGLYNYFVSSGSGSASTTVISDVENSLRRNIPLLFEPDD